MVCDWCSSSLGVGMEFAVGIGVIAIIMFLVLVTVKRKARKDVTSASVNRPSYAAVKIKPIKHHSCQAAYDASYRTFLASEAPTLPLRDCGNPNNCRCSYMHYDDRRHSYRRSPSLSISDYEYGQDKERRVGSRLGRRKTD